MFNIFFQTTTSLVKIPHRFTATQRVTSLQTPKNRPERLYTHFLRSGRYLPAHSDYPPTASLSRCGDALLIATQHPFYRVAARHVATNPTRLAIGESYSLSPTRFTTPSTSVAAGRAASSTRPSGDSSSRRGVCDFAIPSICSSWVRSTLLLRQYSPCRPCR